MATIINNPSTEPRERTVMVESDNSAGWAVAVVILLVIVIAGAYWYMHYRGAATPASGGTNINVTVPATTPATQPSTTQ